MLIQPTLDKLNALKLNGMAIALSDQMTHGAAQGLAFEERLALLLDRESLYRENRRMTRLEQLAQFKQRAALEDLNYRDRTGLDRSQIAALAACDWIRANQNVLIIDDFAIAPIGPRERNDLLELIDDRVGTRSYIVTSQLPIEDWHDYIGEPMVSQCLLFWTVDTSDATPQ